jgi:hypothetical protein
MGTESSTQTSNIWFKTKVQCKIYMPQMPQYTEEMYHYNNDSAVHLYEYINITTEIIIVCMKRFITEMW